MQAKIWVSLVVPIALGLSFVVFRRLVPTSSANPEEEPITDEERRVFRWWEVGACLPFFVVCPLLVFGWYFLLKQAASAFHHDFPDTRFLVEPTPIIWAIPAILLGAFSALIPIDCLYQALLRDRYCRFERYCVERAGVAGNRVCMWLAMFVFTGSAVFFLASVTTFSRFTEEGVEIQRALSFRSTFYDYGRVQLIEHRATFRASNGKTVDRPHHVILFDDGTTWDSREGLRDPLPELDGQIVQLVSRRSARPILERP
jgi:hypothetical protein